MGERTVYCPCENCVHNSVCKYAEAMHNLKFPISNILSTINPPDFLVDIAINCHHFYRNNQSRLKDGICPMTEEIKYITAPVKLTLEIFDGTKKLQEINMDISSNIVTAQLDIHDLIEEKYGIKYD